VGSNPRGQGAPGGRGSNPRGQGAPGGRGFKPQRLRSTGGSWVQTPEVKEHRGVVGSTPGRPLTVGGGQGLVGGRVPDHTRHAGAGGHVEREPARDVVQQRVGQHRGPGPHGALWGVLAAVQEPGDRRLGEASAGLAPEGRLAPRRRLLPPQQGGAEPGWRIDYFSLLLIYSC